MDRIRTILLILLAAFLPFFIQVEMAGARVGPNVVLVTAAVLFLLWEFLGLPSQFNWRSLLSHLASIPRWPVLAAFLSWSVLAVALGPGINGRVQGVWHVYRNAVEMPLVFGIVYLAVRSKGFARQLCLVLIGSATLSAAVGIIQSLSNGAWLTGLGPRGNMLYLGFLVPYPSEIRTYMQRANPVEIAQLYLLPGSDILRAYGGLTRHIYLGALLATVGGLTLGFVLNSQSRRNQLLLGGAFLIQCLGLAFTYSRSAEVTMLVLVGLGLWIASGGFRLRKRVVVAGALLFLIASGTVVLAEGRDLAVRLARSSQSSGAKSPSLGVALEEGRLSSTVLDPEGDAQVGGRLELWRTTLQRIIQRPLLGYGYGTVQVPKWGDVSPHNIFLSIPYTFGIVALVLFLVLWLSFIWDSFWMGLRQQEPLAIGLFLALVGFTLTGLFSSTIAIPDTAPLFWFSAGLLEAIRGTGNRAIIRM